MTKINFLSRNIAIAIACGIALPAFAADVPANAQLAPVQDFTINIGANPATLDPQKMEGTVEGNIARQIFEGLVTSDDNGKILPGVATSWDHSADYKTWTFHLRPDAKWSNGDPVTAEDFVYAWRRLVDPKTASPYASYLEFLKLKNAQDVIEGKLPLDKLGVEAVDAHTLRLNLTESVPYVDKLVELYVLYPVDKKVVEKYGDDWTKPQNIVGNGAFKVKQQIINEKVELVRNPTYWNNKKTVLDKVTMLPIVSGTTDVNRYLAGDEDATASSITSADYKRLKKEIPDQLYTSPILCTYFYEMNNAKPPFNDIRVRQALNLALNRKIITDKVLAQGQVPAYQFSPPLINGADKIIHPSWTKWTQAERDAKAIELLKEAGYDKQHPLDFTLLYNTSESHKQVAIAAQSIWKQNLKGAVNVKLENQEWKTYLDTRNSGNYQMARAGWCADYNEASTFLTYFLSNGSNNSSRFKDKAYDAAVNAAYLAPTQEARAEDYAKAEAILAQQVPVVDVYHYVQSRLLKPYVKGFAIHNTQQNYYLKDVYLEKH